MQRYLHEHSKEKPRKHKHKSKPQDEDGTFNCSIRFAIVLADNFCRGGDMDERD
jgi:hypothetical protein